MTTAFKTKLRDLGYIFYRNVIILANGIILAVVILLFVVGSSRAALFLGIITLINIAVGLIQDIRSWLTLEKLQLLTAPWITRLQADRTEVSVLTNEIEKGDHIKVKIGDQIPCDGTVLETSGLELNEGLITGESNSHTCTVRMTVLAGSLVTSGMGVIQVDKSYQESRIAQMTEGIKKYSVTISSIQASTERFIAYSSYLLFIVIAFVVFRANQVGEPAVTTILSIATLSSILVPQGLVFLITLSFAYGAAHLFQKDVLLQQVNATELLGRIKNLCMDKTGTLTQPSLHVEQIHTPPNRSPEAMHALVQAYVNGSEDSSQIIVAVKSYVGNGEIGTVQETLAFSSWRKYGAIHVRDQNNQDTIILTGAPEVFLPQLSSNEERTWLNKLIYQYTREGKHILCLVQSHQKTVPKTLQDTNLSLIALVVFRNNLREGIQTTIEFFQHRGVHIRVISGDALETVRAVAQAAGINHTDQAITGDELATWSKQDYLEKAKTYSLFARIIPEQKERLIEALKVDGFTAMVGDGANDALAIKKSDLGIAMLDGAAATRKLAAIVLTKNSFTSLPQGVALADRIIRNMEIMASVFLNQTILAFFFFLFTSVAGYSYPLSPFNITLMNYCIIGLPGLLVSYWVVRPAEVVQPASTRPFLKRLMPFALTSALMQAVALPIIFLLIPNELRGQLGNTVTMLSFVFFCYFFFIFASRVYYGPTEQPRVFQFIFVGIGNAAILLTAFTFQLTRDFFNITIPHFSIHVLFEMLGVIGMVFIAQYIVAWFFRLTSPSTSQ